MLTKFALALFFAAPLPLSEPVPEPPALSSLELTGTHWEVVRIDGKDPIEGGNPTWMRFSADYLGVGRGCNGFSARRLESGADRLFKIDQDAPVIAIECAEEVKAQERKIGSIIGGAVRAERPSQDRLIFTTASGETLILQLSVADQPLC